MNEHSSGTRASVPPSATDSGTQEKGENVSNEFDKTYIGDGVYARWDGFAVLLETERDTGTHYIYLEPAHVQSLARLIESEPRIAKYKAGQG